MLQTKTDLEQLFFELQQFQTELKALVAALSGELLKGQAMNDQVIKVGCAKIDLKLRDYTALMSRITAARARAESGAETPDDIIGIRREWGVLSARSNLFRVELNQWSAMCDMVHRQVAAKSKRIPLYDRTVPATVAAQSQASDEIFKLLHAILNPVKQSEDADDLGCFPDVTLPNSAFHQHLHAAYRVMLAQGATQPIRFLDVGCGGGLKVLSAQAYFPQSQGLEYQHSYVDIATRLLDHGAGSDAQVFQADALTFEDYDAYDVIYFYRPMKDDAKLIEMERRIVECARPGTLLIAPYHGFLARHGEHGCGHVAGKIFLNRTGQKDADKLRRLAERTGTVVAPRPRSLPPNVWTPLLEVSQQRGFDLVRYVPPV